MIILGIETSCDETGVCIIETHSTDSTSSPQASLEQAKGDKLTILGNQLYSQVAKHAEYGGVFPMLAKREHAKNLVPLLTKCLEEACLFSSLSLDKERAGVRLSEVEKILSREPELFVELQKLLETVKKPNIDAIAVTNGPGLEPALWVGVTFAKAISLAWNIPVIPTNHMEGHIVAALLSPFPTLDKEGCRVGEAGRSEYEIRKANYPALALLISGGHTQLVLIKSELNYEIIGNTCDDAVGEAYDKVARMLSLPYPGGKIISELAEKERKEFPDKKMPYPLPRPMINSKNLNFSFSGLKTAVLYTLKKIPEITDQVKQEIALEFESAVLDVLSSKVSQAVEEYNPSTLIIGGGVSANPMIRKVLEKVCEKYNLEFLVPEVSAATDNALMIALAGYIRYQVQGTRCQALDFKANGNLSL